MKKLLALLAVFGFIVAANADIGGEFPARFGRIDSVGRVPIARVLCRSAVPVSTPADTSEDTLATCAVPANAMGANGALRIVTLWSNTNSANNKTQRVRLAGSALNCLSQVSTTQVYANNRTYIQNRNSASSQVCTSDVSTSGGAIGNFIQTGTVDTSVAQNLTITCQLALSTENCTLESYIVELLSDGT